MSNPVCGCHVYCDTCDGRGRVPDPYEPKEYGVSCPDCGGNGVVGCPYPVVDQRPDGTPVCESHARWGLP